MFDFAFNFINSRRVKIAAFTQGLGHALRNHADLLLNFGGEGFHLQHNAEFVIGFPNFRHVGAGITGYHRFLSYLSVHLLSTTFSKENQENSRLFMPCITDGVIFLNIMFGNFVNQAVFMKITHSFHA